MNLTGHTTWRRMAVLAAVAAWAGVLGGCQSASPDKPPAPSDPPFRIGGRWQIYRGDRHLTGVAEGKLADSYRMLWRFRTQGEVRSPPTIVDGVVYVGSGGGFVYAIDQKTGRQKWAYETGEIVDAPPLVLDGVLYVGCDDGYLYALSAADGTFRWKFLTQDRIAGSATWFHAADGALRILIASYDSRLYCLDAAGKKVWQYESDDRINGTAAVADGKAVFGGCDAHIHVVDLADGKRIRTIDVGSYIPGSSVLIGRRAFVVTDVGALTCADVETGTILWKFEDLASPIVASPAVGKGEVVIGTSDRTLTCVDRTTHKLRWRFDAKDAIDASPVICGQRVVAGSLAGRLYIFDLADGKVVWSQEVGKGIAGGPAVADGMIVVGGLDGSVFGFVPK